jgi:hypothetical protein
VKTTKRLVQAEFLGVRNEQRGKRRTLVVSKECYVFRDCFQEHINEDINPGLGGGGGNTGVWDEDNRLSRKTRELTFLVTCKAQPL